MTTAGRGIRSLEDIRQRCYVDEETGCWLWRGASTTGQPAMWFPPLQRVVTASVPIGYFATGVAPKRNEYWQPTCGNLMCCSHRERTTLSALMRKVVKRRSPAHRAKLSRGAIRYSDSLVAAIRADAGTLRAVADRHGVSMSYVSRLWRGELRNHGGPFAGLAA